MLVFRILLLVFISTTTYASRSFVDVANIVSVQNVYKEYTIRKPYKECYIKRVRQEVSDNSATNELLGAIVGGAIGNKFGDGGGNDAMTVVGALLGASVANDAEREQNSRFVDKEFCEIKYSTHSENRFSHYLVTYEYKGMEFSYTTSVRPDTDNLKVKLDVSPILN